VIAVSETLGAVVASVVVAMLGTLLAYVLVRTARSMTFHFLGGIVSSRWLTWLGVVISVVGVVDLIWMQVSGVSHLVPNGDAAVVRWELATEPLMLIALGVLVIVAAQILNAIQLWQLVEEIEADPLHE
jgi:hypothetical protein